MGIKITHYAPIRAKQGLAKAFFSIRIEEWDMEIRSLKEMERADGRRWVAFPCQEYTDKNGEKKYTQYFSFGKETSERFQEKVRMALVKYKAERGIQDRPPATEPIDDGEEMPF